MSVKSGAAKAEPSPALKAQLQASLSEPIRPPLSNELGDRVIGALEPISEDFIAKLRAVGVAVFHLGSAIEEPDAKMVSWCSRWIDAKASVLKIAIEGVRELHRRPGCMRSRSTAGAANWSRRAVASVCSRAAGIT